MKEQVLKYYVRKMSEVKRIFVEYQDTDIYNIMSKVIDEKHKDYLDLLVPVICENDRLVEGVFKISSGAGLPEPIPAGKLVLVKLKDIAYASSEDSDYIKDNTSRNEKDQVLCRVDSFRGFHRYLPYRVSCTLTDDNVISFDINAVQLEIATDL